MILKQPVDRRLAGDIKDLPLGPPGAENDDEYNEAKKRGKNTDPFRQHQRASSASKSKSQSRGSLRSPRHRRTPSPHRLNRNRNHISPDSRRLNDRSRMSRFSIRNRSRDRIDRHRNTRDRFRKRRDTRSRSTSPIPRRRWSPKNKQRSPAISCSQYNMVDPGIYAEGYSNYGHYGPPQQGYVHGDFLENTRATFTTGYPPPPAWGTTIENYQSQNWMQESMATSVIQEQQPGIEMQTPVQLTSIQRSANSVEILRKNDMAVTQDAVAQEAENQRDELKKQRTSYLKKTVALKKELKTLKEQRRDLIEDSGLQSPTTKKFLDENERLQLFQFIAMLKSLTALKLKKYKLLC